jgi:hypothetical protein
LVLTGQQVTVDVGIAASPASLVIDGGQITTDLGIAAGVASLVIDGQAPGVTGGDVGDQTVSPSAGELVINGQQVTLDLTLQASPAALVIDGQQPTLDMAISTSPASLVIDGQAPTVTVSTDVIVVHAASLVIDGFAPTLVGGEAAEVAVSVGAGSPGKRRLRERRKRYILPDGTHVFATPEEAVQAAEALTGQMVVVAEKRPKKPTKLVVLDDGARIQAPVVYPTGRLRTSMAQNERVRASQVAPDEDIIPQALLTLAVTQLQEEQRRRRRRRNTALALLYAS